MLVIILAWWYLTFLANWYEPTTWWKQARDLRRNSSYLQLWNGIRIRHKLQADPSAWAIGPYTGIKQIRKFKFRCNLNNQLCLWIFKFVFNNTIQNICILCMILAELNVIFSFQKRRIGLAVNRLQRPNIKDARLYSYIIRNSNRLRNPNADHRFRRHLRPYFAAPFTNRLSSGQAKNLGIILFIYIMLILGS